MLLRRLAGDVPLVSIVVGLALLHEREVGEIFASGIHR